MAKNAVGMPQDKSLLNDLGSLKTPWIAFFTRLQKTPATALPDLTGGASTSDIIARVNALAQILRDNDLLDDNT